MILTFECIACNKCQKTATNLNRHLNECKEYENFIKKYIPPKNIPCKKCNLTFISREYLNNHTCN